MVHASRREKLLYRNKIKNEGRRLVIRLMKAGRKREQEIEKQRQEEIKRMQAQGKILQGPSPFPPNMMRLQGGMTPGGPIQAIPIQLTEEQFGEMLKAHQQANIFIPQ
jgi:hypothetical protein